jgi:hypothetical protein
VSRPPAIREGHGRIPLTSECEAIITGAKASVAIPVPEGPTVGTGTRRYRTGTLEALKWAFSFPVLLGMWLVGATFYCGRAFHVDPDLWWHVKVGQSILSTHHWPTTDPYSFTVHGQPWMAYEWGGEVLLGWTSRIAGIRGLDFLLVALGAAVILALYGLGTLRAGNSKAGFLTVAVLLLFANVSFTLRPQMLGYLFLVLTVTALELFRQGKRWMVWCLPALMLVWVNTHGSFIIGLGVIAAYWMCGLVAFRKGGLEAKQWNPRERRTLSLVFLLCLAVLPITPYGTKLAVYPFNMAFSQPLNIGIIAEWQPMPFNLALGKIFLALVLVFFLLQIVFGFVWRVEELLLFFAGFALATLHSRFVLLFVPFATPMLATMAARWTPAYSRAKDKYLLNGVLMAAVVVAMIHYFPSQKNLDQKVADVFPVQAVEYLRQHPISGPMFDSYAFGGYLIGAGYPTFIDGRADIFERGGILRDYLELVRLKPGGLDVLRRYGIESCLVERNEPLSTVLQALPGWRRVYADKVTALFVRMKPLDRAVVAPPN